MEEMAKPNYEWSGWRKKGTRTINLIPLTNLESGSIVENFYHKSRSLARKKCIKKCINEIPALEWGATEDAQISQPSSTR